MMFYDVYVRWAAASNRDTAVPIDIIYPGGTNTYFVNQQSGGGVWNRLITTNFTAGTNWSVVVRNDGTTGYVIADAVRFVSKSGPATTVEIVATDGSAREYGPHPAKITLLRSGDTNSALTIGYSLGGSASNGTDYSVLSGTLSIPPGITLTNILVTPLMDSLSEGTETVLLTITNGSNYAAGVVNSATVFIQDNPPVRLLSPEYESNGFRFRFTGTPGAGYSIQRAPAVTGPWTTVTNAIAGSDGAVEWLDNEVSTHDAFYRILIE